MFSSGCIEESSVVVEGRLDFETRKEEDPVFLWGPTHSKGQAADDKGQRPKQVNPGNHLCGETVVALVLCGTALKQTYIQTDRLSVVRVV